MLHNMLNVRARMVRLFPLLPVPAMAVAVSAMPFSHAEEDFWNNMWDALRTGHTTTTFLPGFYPFLCSLVYRPFGPAGIEAFQALIYMALAVCTWWMLRRWTGNGPVAAAAAGLIVLNPDLLSSIPKLWDTEVTALLLAGLVAVCLALDRGRPGRVVVLGAVWGLGLAVRPNFIFLAFPIAFALWGAYGRAALVRLAGVGVLALGVVAGANTVAHGSFYLPSNGPYNLFAGANASTRPALLRDLNAEPSIRPAMEEHGYAARDFYDATLNPVFTRFAVQFMTAHPLEWLGLGVLKLGTLLRPDLKAHRLFSADGALKLLTCFCVPVWLVLLGFSRRLGEADRLVILFVAAYVLPFVLTNADPRFRPALDTLVLTHSAALLICRYGPARSASQGCRESAGAWAGVRASERQTVV